MNTQARSDAVAIAPWPGCPSRLLVSGVEHYAAYREQGGYRPVADADELLGEVESSGLVGRGGAAFPLAVKLRTVRDNGRLSGGTVAVANGEHYLSPSISGYLVRRRGRAESLASEKPGLDTLTKAERRILKLVADKKTSKEIAAELFISPRTVEAHRANISTKLELHGSHSLLQFALENRSSL